jgi:hypothetical protein
MSSKRITVVKIIPVPDEYAPKPAANVLPEWYKKTDSYVYGNTYRVGPLGPLGPSQGNQTIKKCTPVFDALTSGYIIPTYADLWVEKIDGVTTYTFANNVKVEFHHVAQAPYHPHASANFYPKFANAWAIKTPPGYSCLFTDPFHGTNPFFTVLDGIVDTDTYPSTVNFPFVLKDPNFEGLIPAGTPMVQVIPFKRDSWKMTTSLDKSEIEKTDALLNTRFKNRYKSLFWSKKEYR